MNVATLPLAVTMGEPAGIGGEIALKAWLSRAPAPRALMDPFGRAGTPKDALPSFYLVDDPDRLAALARSLGWPVPVHPIAAPEEAVDIFAGALPVQPVGIAVHARPAYPDPADAPAILGAIDSAVAAVRQGRAAAVVTNPIHKENLYRAGFRHPGHTEYLAELAGTGTVPIMMLASPALRVVPVTIHLPLRRAAESLSSAAIVHAGRVTQAGLRTDFGIAAPRLTVAGLNPHAGEGGGLGREDIEIIVPAIAELCALGIDARGPLPADTMFHTEARRGYDAALCMYHDQALIPLKTIDFWDGVNVTLGLPFVRTSPDHGTAFAIAGRGIARADSLIAALRLAAEMAARRRAAASD